MGIISIIHFDSGYSIQKTFDENKKITEHFTFAEESNTSALQRVKLELWTQSLVHARMREEFRMLYYAYTGRVLPCTSCYRTKEFNEACGGIPDSLHLWATASDVTVPNLGNSLWNWSVDNWAKICASYGTVGEIGRYPEMEHLGSHIELTPHPYTDEFYIFDKR